MRTSLSTSQTVTPGETCASASGHTPTVCPPCNHQSPQGSTDCHRTAASGGWCAGHHETIFESPLRLKRAKLGEELMQGTLNENDTGPDVIVMDCDRNPGNVSNRVDCLAGKWQASVKSFEKTNHQIYRKHKGYGGDGGMKGNKRTRRGGSIHNWRAASC